MTYEPFHIIANVGGVPTVFAMLEYPASDVPDAITVAENEFVRKEPKMVKLHYEEIPDRKREEYKYMKYVPIIKEFLVSDKDSAYVEDDESVLSTTLVARLRSAIAHADAPEKVMVRQRSGKVYLVKRELPETH